MNHKMRPAWMFPLGSICRKPRCYAVVIALLIAVCLAAVPTAASAALIIDFAVTRSDPNLQYDGDWFGTIEVGNPNLAISDTSNISLITATSSKGSVAFNPDTYFPFDLASLWGGKPLEMFWTAATILQTDTWSDLLNASPIALNDDRNQGTSGFQGDVTHESLGGFLSLTSPSSAQAVPEPSSLALAVLVLGGCGLVAARRQRKRCK